MRRHRPGRRLQLLSRASSTGYDPVNALAPYSERAHARRGRPRLLIDRPLARRRECLLRWAGLVSCHPRGSAMYLSFMLSRYGADGGILPQPVGCVDALVLTQVPRRRGHGLPLRQSRSPSPIRVDAAGPFMDADASARLFGGQPHLHEPEVFLLLGTQLPRPLRLPFPTDLEVRPGRRTVVPASSGASNRHRGPLSRLIGRRRWQAERPTGLPRGQSDPGRTSVLPGAPSGTEKPRVNVR